MIYEFKCEEHGIFEVRQSIFAEHKANCPKCGKISHRVFTSPQWIWAGSLYRPDGSRREDKDYAEVMRG